MSETSDALTRDISGRLAGIAEDHSVKLMEAADLRERVGLVANLVDPKTGLATSESIVLDLHAGDAWMFANLVLQLAKERGWKFGAGAQSEMPAHKKAMN